MEQLAMARSRNIAEQSGLAQLFEICTTKKVGWSDEDYGDIFRHLLDAPILRELELGGGVLQSLDLGNVAPEGRPIQTFDELLRNPYPPLELLRCVKDFAKGAQHRTTGALPAPIAEALYVLTVAVALTRRGIKISALNDSDLRQGFEWASQQSWIGVTFRQLADEAIVSLETR
jgi:hypothetical protein